MLDLAHKQLDVWKISVNFVKDIYTMTNSFPKSEMYGITNQLCRASVSIPSNIAEGSARSTAKERIRFYQIARSSLVEIDTQLEICKKLGYYQELELTEISKKMNLLFAMLTNLVRKTK